MNRASAARTRPTGVLSVLSTYTTLVSRDYERKLGDVGGHKTQAPRRQRTARGRTARCMTLHCTARYNHCRAVCLACIAKETGGHGCTGMREGASHMQSNRLTPTSRYSIQRNFHGITARQLIKAYVSSHPHFPPTAYLHNTVVSSPAVSAALPVSSLSSSSPRFPRSATTS